MRPVRRRASPQSSDYSDYRDAKVNLVSRISSGTINGEHAVAYCSYCERVVTTNLAVEHIEPKGGDFGKPELKGRWENFLLSCVNCNSTKKDKPVDLSKLFFPDRDNTFAAFSYQADGKILPSSSLTSDQQLIAQNTLELTGLEKKIAVSLDENGKQIAFERVSQRMHVWGCAELSLKRYLSSPTNTVLQDSIIDNMVLSGYFSVWMTVFKNHPEMKHRFIDAISGTRESGCFDPSTSASISPHPNRDGLQDGGKI